MLAIYFASGDDHIFEFSISADAIGEKMPILAVELNTDHLCDPNVWFIIVGFLTALGLILPILNFVLTKLLLWMNDIENHRTKAEYRNHFIIKMFAFRFVCYFTTLYLLLFIYWCGPG